MPNHQEQERRYSGTVGWFRSKITLQASSSVDVDECLACATEFPLKRLIVLTCPESHKYCHGCFEQLILSGCQNELAFPPRCCQISVPRNLIRSHASRKARKIFEDLTETTKISPDSRWYCPHSKCYKAIDVETAKVTDKGMKCPHCHRHICILCKQGSHSKDSQCSNGALTETLRTSQQNGWRSCFKCGEMVELREGCRHITCRCRAEFCYICGQKWGKCISSHKCVQKLEEIRAEENRRRALEQDEEEPMDEETMDTRPDGMRRWLFELDTDSDDESLENDTEGNVRFEVSDRIIDVTEDDTEDDAENNTQDHDLTQIIEQSALEYFQLQQRERELQAVEDTEMFAAMQMSMIEFRESQRLAEAAERVWVV